MRTRYVLVEVSEPDHDPFDAEWVRDVLAGDGHLADELGVTFRTADVTAMVTKPSWRPDATGVVVDGDYVELA